VTLIGKIMCYAIVALAMDLIWGYAGILSLGHGLFFALGGYAMGMYLMRQIGARASTIRCCRTSWCSSTGPSCPGTGTELRARSLWAMLLVVLVPGLLAFVFGWLAFRSRIKGVYFSIITQALTFAAMLPSSATRPVSAATTASPISSASSASDQAPTRPAWRSSCGRRRRSHRHLLLALWLVTSKFGRVLPRSATPNRARDVLGYNPLNYKLVRWTLSAVHVRHRRRALRAAGRHHQSERMSPASSIEIASGSRSAGAARWSAPPRRRCGQLRQDLLHRPFPEYWLFALGGLFISSSPCSCRRGSSAPCPTGGPGSAETRRRTDGPRFGARARSGGVATEMSELTTRAPLSRRTSPSASTASAR
jgi:urea transport system permease protein